MFRQLCKGCAERRPVEQTLRLFKVNGALVKDIDVCAICASYIRAAVETQLAAVLDIGRRALNSNNERKSQ